MAWLSSIKLLWYLGDKYPHPCLWPLPSSKELYHRLTHLHLDNRPISPKKREGKSIWPGCFILCY